MNAFNAILLLIISYQILKVQCEVARNIQETVNVNKCCNEDEIYIGNSCTIVNNTIRWQPLFTSESGIQNIQVDHK